jgi:hypothetical protein
MLPPWNTDVSDVQQARPQAEEPCHEPSRPASLHRSYPALLKRFDISDDSCKPSDHRSRLPMASRLSRACHVIRDAQEWRAGGDNSRGRPTVSG